MGGGIKKSDKNGRMMRAVAIGNKLLLEDGLPPLVHSK